MLQQEALRRSWVMSSLTDLLVLDFLLTKVRLTSYVSIGPFDELLEIGCHCMLNAVVFTCSLDASPGEAFGTGETTQNFNML